MATVASDSCLVYSRDCKIPPHVACSLWRDFCLNSVTVKQIFGLFPAESEIDVYVDMWNQVMDIMRAES